MMEPRERPLQISLKWLMLQTALVSLAVVLYNNLGQPAGDALSLLAAASTVGFFCATGTAIGGCFGSFRIGASVGFFQGLIIVGFMLWSELT